LFKTEAVEIVRKVGAREAATIELFLTAATLRSYPTMLFALARAIGERHAGSRAFGFGWIAGGTETKTIDVVPRAKSRFGIAMFALPAVEVSSATGCTCAENFQTVLLSGFVVFETKLRVLTVFIPRAPSCARLNKGGAAL